MGNFIWYFGGVLFPIMGNVQKLLGLEMSYFPTGNWEMGTMSLISFHYEIYFLSCSFLIPFPSISIYFLIAYGTIIPSDMISIDFPISFFRFPGDTYFSRSSLETPRGFLQSLPKRLSFVVDVSGSMAVFNGDGRLDRLMATMVTWWPVLFERFLGGFSWCRMGPPKIARAAKSS